MKKIISMLTLLVCTISMQGQQLYPFKERYDQVLEPSYSTAVPYTSTTQQWWYGWGDILRSYIRLYETTGDKAYLNKFVKHAYNIQMQRNNVSYMWTGMFAENNEVLYTGQLLQPMAEFIHLVKTNNALYTTYLYPGLIPSSIGSYQMLGYGDFANWLQGRVTETMDHVNNTYWINDELCYSNEEVTTDQRDCLNAGCDGLPCIGTSCPSTIAINWNASYASVMFYIGSADPISYSHYTTKAGKIVDFFKSRVDLYSPNQSYTWWHDDGGEFREDVSHAAIDLIIPLTCEKVGNSHYQLSELNLFSRTFSQNIYDKYDVQFHNNVFGLDYDLPDGDNLTPCNYPANGTVNVYGPGEVLAWMPMYEFESAPDLPHDIYTVLSTQAEKLLADDPTAILPAGYCYSTTSQISGAQAFCGIAEVVKAQWEKECANLTLYNRIVDYDQDFFVKNSLTIAPQLYDNVYHPINSPSFADPVTTDNLFIVSPQKTSNMIAGEKIVMEAGFIAEYGSTFSASINPSNCTDGLRIAASGGNSFINPILSQDTSLFSRDQEAGNKNLALKNISKISNIRAVPNPSNGVFHLIGDQVTEPVVTMIYVYDVLGNVVLARTIEISAEGTQVDLSKESKGIYYLHLRSEGQSAAIKIIVQ